MRRRRSPDTERGSSGLFADDIRDFHGRQDRPPGDARYTSIGPPLPSFESDARKRASSSGLMRPLMTIDRLSGVAKVAAFPGDASSVAANVAARQAYFIILRPVFQTLLIENCVSDRTALPPLTFQETSCLVGGRHSCGGGDHVLLAHLSCDLALADTAPRDLDQQRVGLIDHEQRRWRARPRSCSACVRPVA